MNFPAVSELTALGYQHQECMEKVLTLLPEIRQSAFTFFTYMDQAIGQMRVDSLTQLKALE